MSGGQIDTVMHEDRKFPPPAEFAAKAQIGSLEAYEELYARAKADPEKFWGDLAESELHWFQPFTKVLEWNEPFAKWFVGGQTNVSYNCLDAHLTTPRREQGRHHLGRGAGRAADADLSAAASRGLQVRQCAEEAGREARATW